MCKYPYKYQFISMVSRNPVHRINTVGERIEYFCDKYGMTKVMFAALANEYARKYNVRVTDQDIYNYTSGHCSPKIDKLTAIAKVMGVPVSFFCGFGACECKSKKKAIEDRRVAVENAVQLEF